MPDIDGQKSPVRRDYSVKTEVQLFFSPGKFYVTASPIYLIYILNFSTTIPAIGAHSLGF